MQFFATMIVLVLFFWFLFALALIPVDKAIDNNAVDCLIDRNTITCIELKKMNRGNDDSR